MAAGKPRTQAHIARGQRRLRRIRRAASEYLGLLAKLRLPRSYGQTIGITGSLGKTSTTNAIAHLLQTEFGVQASTPEYNTRLGLLLSIFRQKSGEGSPKAWLRAMVGASRNFLTDRSRYEKLVLEMGVSWPGGMADTLRAFRPDIAVFTGVAPTHLGRGQFADEQAIFDEKAKLVRTMKAGAAILNRDNEFCQRLEEEDLWSDVFWYGRLPEGNGSRSPPPGVYFDRLGSSLDGISGIVHCFGVGGLEVGSHELTAAVIGEQHVYVLLPAILVGMISGLGLSQCCEALGTYSLPAGRMTPIPGINSSMILDSTRNATPLAVEAALETLRTYPCTRRIALLGSMLELGEASEPAHRAIGQATSRCAQLLVTVGEQARLIAEGARNAGMDRDAIECFDTPEEAGVYIRDQIRAGDALLVKGSRRIRLECAIELFMLHPDRAGQLLFQQ